MGSLVSLVNLRPAPTVDSVGGYYAFAPARKRRRAALQVVSSDGRPRWVPDKPKARAPAVRLDATGTKRRTPQHQLHGS